MIRAVCGTLRIILGVFVVVLFMSIYFILTKTVVKNTPERGFWLRRVILTIINPILGIKIDAEINLYDKPALYVSNHRGLLDFFVSFKYINAFVLAKASVKNMPLVGFAGNVTGIIYVQRDNKSSRTSARQEIVKILKSGSSVFLYPEGTTNTEKTTMEFKIGSFEEAFKHGFPVIPVAQEYKSKDDLWLKDNVFQQFYSQFGKCKSEVKISIGEPIQAESPKELMENSKRWIDTKLLQMQEGWSTAYD